MALVSGASVGIGFEIAKELARAGMKVVAFSRNPEKIQVWIQLVDHVCFQKWKVGILKASYNASS